GRARRGSAPLDRARRPRGLERYTAVPDRRGAVVLSPAHGHCGGAQAQLVFTPSPAEGKNTHTACRTCWRTLRTVAMIKGFSRHRAPLCSRKLFVSGARVSPVRKIIRWQR